MAHTLRRRPWYPDPPLGKRRWYKVHNDSTCKPGCAVCGKDKTYRRLKHKRTRAQGKIAAQVIV